MFPSGNFAPATVVLLRVRGFGEQCSRLRLFKKSFFAMIVIIARLISVTAFIFHSQCFSPRSK